MTTELTTEQKLKDMETDRDYWKSLCELIQGYMKTDNVFPLVDLLMKDSRDKDTVKEAMKNMLLNLVNTKPSVFRDGMLFNIKMALGKEEYDRWYEYYS